MTSEFRDDVSEPTRPCRSMRRVDDSGWEIVSCRAIARPTAPPPMTAWVKSAWRWVDVEKQAMLGT